MGDRRREEQGPSVVVLGCARQTRSSSDSASLSNFYLHGTTVIHSRIQERRVVIINSETIS